VIEASADAATETIERLHRAWRHRERVVIAWTGPLPDEFPTLDVAFHTLSPDTELPGERLRFAISANAIDLLDGAPTFAPLNRGLDLGGSADLAPANPAPGGPAPDDTAPGGQGTVSPGTAGAKANHGPTGDLALPDGTQVWVDGGPLDHLPIDDLAQVPVVPRVHLVAGTLRPEHLERRHPSASLASDQLEAVEHRGGPARIIAPAGSGKTRVLTERARHLVADRGISPAAVALVAYNRRARAEMAGRLHDLAGLDIRTLNSLALAIATGRGPFAASGHRSSRATIDEPQARRLLQDLIPGRRRRQLTDPLEPWIDALSACRLGLRDPEEVEAAYGADVAGFPEVLDRYRAALARAGHLDFDEQILSAIEVLLTDPAALATARRAAPLLLVDEFQDLTPAHLLLVRLLAGPAAEVFAVGDDDQTIYGYSGASPTWLVDFGRYFPGAADHPLRVNYRCPPPVVAAAVNLLSHNRHRVAKEIVAGARDLNGPEASDTDESSSGTSDAGDGPVPALAVETVADPQRAVVERVERLLSRGATPDQIAVLARVNAALLPPAVYLSEAGHPVARPAGVDTHLLERSGIAAALAWLRLASAPEQRLAPGDLRLALRRPPRSIHPRIVDWVCEQSSVKGLVALSNRLNSERDANHLAELAADIASLRRLHDDGASTVELLDAIFADIGLLGAASQLDQSQRTARRAAHADELTALRAVADIGPGPDQLEDWIRERLASLAGPEPSARPAGDADRPPAITLATVHSTKGLEWDHVIVHDVRGDLHPHRLASDTEEERRIFHVAITRGRRSVLVNAVAAGRDHPPSPFLAELAAPRPANAPWPTDVDPTDGQGAAGRNRTASRSAASASGPAKRERGEPASPAEAVRREALTAWRLERCRTDGVPAYVVLDNATLDAIAAAAPSSLGELGGIKGIGPAKLERYGADILGIVESTAGS
jgi:DNA helicase-2/ATP-dependent DNA helicase PcrA